MKRYIIQILSLFFISFSGVLIAQTPAPKLMMEVEGLPHCESVVYDSSRNVYYVSVMADAEEGDGSIAKVNADGNIEDLKFVDRLNDPKGLAIKGDKLYVSDGSFLVEIDLKNGQVVSRFRGYKAKSLNDVAIDSRGYVYVSDMGNNSIYRLDDEGNFKEWFHSDELQTPNGLLAEGDDLYVAGWASAETKDSDEPRGGFIMLKITGKDVIKITKELGNLDGIQKYDENNFLVSSWNTGEIFKISKDGKIDLVMKAERSVGDILYLPKKNILSLPMNIQNRVLFYRYK